MQLQPNSLKKKRLPPTYKDIQVDLHKIGIKIFAGEGSNTELVEFIPVFHRWIQNKLIDQLLLDVADYSHIQAGPGIVLVAHEGNYAVDETGGRRGLLYYSKEKILAENLAEKICIVAAHTLKACQLLNGDAEISSKISFPGNELEIFSNDRLLAPNTEETWKAIEPGVRTFLDKLYAGQDYSIIRNNDPKERFQLTVKAAEPVAIDKLLQHITG